MGSGDIWYAGFVDGHDSRSFGRTSGRYGQFTWGKALLSFCCCTYRLTSDQRTYIIEHGARIYDLTEAVDVFQLAVTLIKIRNLGQQLYKRCSDYRMFRVEAERRKRQASPKSEAQEKGSTIMSAIRQARKFEETFLEGRSRLWTREAQISQAVRSRAPDDVIGAESSKS